MGLHGYLVGWPKPSIPKGFEPSDQRCCTSVHSCTMQGNTGSTCRDYGFHTHFSPLLVCRSSTMSFCWSVSLLRWWPPPPFLLLGLWAQENPSDSSSLLFERTLAVSQQENTTFGEQDFKHCRHQSFSDRYKCSLGAIVSNGNWCYSYFHHLVPESIYSSHWDTVPDRSLWINAHTASGRIAANPRKVLFPSWPFDSAFSSPFQQSMNGYFGMKKVCQWPVDSTVMGPLLHLSWSQVGPLVQCFIAWILHLWVKNSMIFQRSWCWTRLLGQERPANNQHWHLSLRDKTGHSRMEGVDVVNFPPTGSWPLY